MTTTNTNSPVSAKNVQSEAALLAHMTVLFTKRLVTQQDKYDRAVDFVSARTRGIGSTAQVAAINRGLLTKDATATLTTAGNISHYLKAWDLVLAAGIVPTDQVELVARSHTATSGGLKKDQQEALVTRIRELDQDVRVSAMIAQLISPVAVEKVAAEKGEDGAVIDPEDVTDPATIKGVVEKSRAGFAGTVSAMIPNIGGLTAVELDELIGAADALIEAAKGLQAAAIESARVAQAAEWAADDKALADAQARIAARVLVTA